MSRALPIAALLFNAFTWGVSWLPFRWLLDHGLHPLWVTAMTYALAVAGLTLARPGAWRRWLAAPWLWLLALSAGCANALFNWGITVGEVARVVLLFYLMPVWAVLLARLLLGEPVTARALACVLVSLAGAACVLWSPQTGVPVPSGLADWLGLGGGIGFALTNVLLRRQKDDPGDARALAMFAGASAFSALLALGLPSQVPAPPDAAALWVMPLLAFGLVFIASNFALQFGASRLPANVTAVVMLSEVVFATLSAAWLGGEALGPRGIMGGLLIVGAAAWSSLAPAPRPAVPGGSPNGAMP